MNGRFTALYCTITARLGCEMCAFIGDFEKPTIVGYKTVSISADQFMALGVIFENVEGGAIPVKDVAQVGNITGSSAMGASDQIWRWDSANGNWIKYFYFVNSRQGIRRWVLSTDTTVETADTIPAGETFFFKRASGATATTLSLSGAVKDMSGTKSATVAGDGFAFISNPWPVALNISDFNNLFTSGTVTGSSAMGASDQIWLWDSENANWVKYFYFVNSRQGIRRWVLSSDTSVETSETIPAGVGFFFKRASGASTATLTFEGPNAE